MPSATVSMAAIALVASTMFPSMARADDCTPLQLSTAGRALSVARNMLDQAIVATEAESPGNRGRLSTWFGPSTPAADVRSTLLRARKAADKVTLECYPPADNEDEEVFAEVGPDDEFMISLGGLFWTAPDRGYSTKPGTLIHELTHFLLVAGADDFVYGVEDAKLLAGSNPDEALRNADNFEFYVEATFFGLT